MTVPNNTLAGEVFRDAWPSQLPTLPGETLVPCKNAMLVALNDTLKHVSIGMQLEMDKATGSIVAQVVNAETGQFVRHMPLDEVKLLAKTVAKLHDILVNEAVFYKAPTPNTPRVCPPNRWSNASAMVSSSANRPLAMQVQSAKAGV